MALVCVVVAKVFLIDMAGLKGLLRVFSFLGLGAALVGLGYAYRRFGLTPESEQPVPRNDLSLDALRDAAARAPASTALRHAYDHQAPYRAKCAGGGRASRRSPPLEDLQRFPFTAKADLRDAYPFGMLAIPREQCVRIHASSGTTGRPTVVGYSARDIDTWADLMARSLYAGGARPGDIIHNAYGYGLFTGGLVEDIRT